MKRDLQKRDIEAAVIGGAILGGGGGGMIEPGLQMAKLALEVGIPQLWSVDEFQDDDLTVTVALVGAPAAPHPFMKPRDFLRTLELLKRELGSDRRLVAINTNENGAQTTVNGWFHSALSGLPLLDLACNGRAHPSSLMGSLGLHLEDDYISIQAYAGGEPVRYIEGVTSGKLASTSGVVRRASIEAGGLVTTARNPVEIAYAAKHGAPSAISKAIDLGHAFLNGGLKSATQHLGAEIVAQAKVKHYECVQRDGLDVGLVVLDDDAKTTLHFVNEYMLTEQNGNAVGNFPDLIMTFDENDQPLVSAHVREGQKISVLQAPAAQLSLSRTMFMPELFEPIEVLINRRIFCKA